MITIEKITDTEKYIEGIDAVIFDLDDTLYSEKEYVKSGYKAVAKRFKQFENLEERLWNAFLNGGKAIDEVFSEENAECYISEAIDEYRRHVPEIHFYDGVEAMLTRLSQKGKKVGIITDGRPEGQRAKMRALGIVNTSFSGEKIGKVKVDSVIITDEFGGIEYRKPNPIAFEKMQKEMNIPFERMVYIGDNMKKDFIAPNYLGMESIWFINPDSIYY